jgi:hypothetical protein
MTWRRFVSRNRGLVASALALGAVAILSGIALFILINEDRPELRVEETYFESSMRKGDKIPIEVIVVLTNDGKADAGSVRVEILAVETDSNLARSNGSSPPFNLDAGKTQEIRSEVRVPRNATYRLEILIFRAQKLTIWGFGIVDLRGLGEASDYRTERNLDEPIGDENESKDSSASICIIYLMVAGGIGGLIILVLYLRKKGGKEEPAPQEERARTRPEKDNEGIEGPEYKSDTSEDPKGPPWF